MKLWQKIAIAMAAGGAIIYLIKRAEAAPPEARLLTEEAFRTIPATGTAENPQRMNNGDTGNACIMYAIGDYCEVQFPYLALVSEFRYNGWSQNLDGSYKIQYWDGIAWVDLNVGIPTRRNEWSTWVPLTTEVITEKVRWVATAMDTFNGRNYLSQVEMRGRLE